MNFPAVRFLFVVFTVALVELPLLANNQTDTYSPILPSTSLPFRLEIVPVHRPGLPTLHSFTAAEHDGKWLLIAGRTNGLHGFSNIGIENFPTQYQNEDAWVVDPVTGQTWQRHLGELGAGLSTDVIASLSVTNSEFAQIGNDLYIVGGYGATSSGEFITFDTLSQIDVAGMVDWVQGGTSSAASQIQQLHDPLFKVAGGALHELGGALRLSFGQDFNGTYIPGRSGAYTHEIRSFEVVDTEAFEISEISRTLPKSSFRRRDLNVIPTVSAAAGGEVEYQLVALAGVFTRFVGAWTVPVEFDGSGEPRTDDPITEVTFRQSMNIYHSAKAGFYSAASDTFYEALFGGITFETFDAATGQVLQDSDMPFTNQVAVVSRHGGTYQQHWLGEMPELFDQDGNRLRFGANAEFLPAAHNTAYAHDIFDLDALEDGALLGHVFGGIVANAPHTFGVPGAVTAASDQLFEVRYRMVPEPAAGTIPVVFYLLVLMRHGCRRQR